MNIAQHNGQVNAELARDLETAIWQRQARAEGLELRFLCPVHEDHNPSARYHVDKHVWTCDVCGAGGGAKKLAEVLGIPTTAYASTPKPSRRIVATYDYVDEKSQLLFQTVRYQPKDFAQRQPDSSGDWIWDLKNVRRVLYRLPELLAADPTETVYHSEGEKDTDRLRSISLVATTNPQGAGKWRSEYTASLAGRHVVIFPHNDDAGRKHGEKVARSIASVAASVKIVELPGLAEKGDVSDWLDQGGDRAQLEALVSETETYRDDAATATEDVGRFRLNDVGNARRLGALHGEDLRFCRVTGQWLLWDSRRWKADQTGAIYRYATATAASIYAEAAAEPNDLKRRDIVKWAMQSESRSRLEAMVSLAEKIVDDVPIAPDELDAEPWLLTCLNGTLDLRIGQLRPSRREDLLTKLCPVEYDPAAQLDLWERFLDDSTGSDRDLQAFLQRAVGYSLTGDISEEKLFFVHGPAASGKSTFLEALKAMLGECATTADFDAFLARRDSGGPRNDIARLAGARAVISIEVDEGKRLAEGLVKTITGGDTVTARFLYQEAFEFFPTFKLWLAANHAPKVNDDDAAMWRRILRIPFEHVVPKEKRDPKVKAALRDPKLAGPSILAWAVRGCLDWQRNGLGVPPIVEKATESLRQDMDPLKDFLADMCELKSSAWTVAGELRKAYEEWAKENGEKKPLGSRAWGEKLRAHDCTPDRVKVGSRTERIWRGIRLLDSEEQAKLEMGDEKTDDSRTESDARTEYDPRIGNLEAVPLVRANLPNMPSDSVRGADSVREGLGVCVACTSARATVRGKDHLPYCAACAYLGDLDVAGGG